MLMRGRNWPKGRNALHRRRSRGVVSARLAEEVRRNGPWWHGEDRAAREVKRTLEDELPRMVKGREVGGKA